MDPFSHSEDRYRRQVVLPGVGEAGQAKLGRARILVVGLGGLGCPAAQYLAAAGVGTLGLADFDTVSVSNLHRQILYQEDSVGQLKVDVAARRLAGINSAVRLDRHREGLTPVNALELVRGYDLVLDCTDNFPARYLVNDAAALSGIPCVHGSIFQHEGQVTVFHPKAGGPCYRCLFPEFPDEAAIPNCAEAGVLGALCGIIGSWQANEALKWILSAGEPLIGRIKLLDALAGTERILALPRNPDCPLCGTNPTIGSIQGENYRQASCQAESGADLPLDIDVRKAAETLMANPGTLLLDVREPAELAICSTGRSVDIPLGELPHRLEDLPMDAEVLVICHHGSRSRRAARLLRSRGWPRAQSIQGGIDVWARIVDPTLSRY